MRTPICDVFGIKYPIFGFSPNARVVLEVSRAGGLGVLGAIGTTPDSLEESLTMLDRELNGIPYGVDFVMPAKSEDLGTTDVREMGDRIRTMIPDTHRQFVESLMDKWGIPPMPEGEQPQGGRGGAMGGGGILGWTESVARSQAEVAFAHPIKLIANALGPPPQDIIDQAHGMGIKVAALAGKPQHAERHINAGVDMIVCQSYEAGGHTGDIGGMVLLPEVVDAVAPRPVLAAGAMATGRQVAAAMALGAQGAWCGSVWLTTTESTGGRMPERYLHATSSDTVRSKAITGKAARQLRTAWTDAWEGPDSPGTLPMPLQNFVAMPALARAARAGRTDVGFAPIGQVVGMLNEVRPVSAVVEEMVRGYEEALARITGASEANAKR